MARGKGKTIPIKVKMPKYLHVIRNLFSCNSHSIRFSTLDLRKLLSTAGTGYFYTTRRNVTATPEKFKFVKFDPIVRRKVLFTEAKIK